MERSKSLSIKAVKTYKLLVAGLVLTAVMLYVIFMTSDKSIGGFIAAITYVFLLVLYWYPNLRKVLSNLKQVSYDSQNLYVHKDDYEVQIPFHEVKDIEIVSLDGLYKFSLYDSNQFGNEVICKPSIWYPLNFRRVDLELNRIRSLVRKAHLNYKSDEDSSNRLASN